MAANIHQMPSHGLFRSKSSASADPFRHSRFAGLSNRISDGSISSFGMTSTWRTSSTSGSWITCSNAGDCDQGAALAETDILSDPDNNNEEDALRFDSLDMLSAADRRKKRSLPQMRRRASSTAQPEDLPASRNSTSTFSSRDLQPRGASERQDSTELRAYFDQTRARPDERSLAYLPKSHFEWDSSSDGDSGIVAKEPTFGSIQRVARRVQAAGSGVGNMMKAPSRMFATMPGVDGWMESALKYAEEKRNEIEATKDGERRSNSVSLHTDLTKSPRSPLSQEASVLKLFRDPVWTDNRDISQAIISGIADTSTTSLDCPGRSKLLPLRRATSFKIVQGTEDTGQRSSLEVLPPLTHNQNTGDPFLDGVCQEVLLKKAPYLNEPRPLPRGEDHTFGSNGGLDTPTRDEKRRNYVPPGRIYATVRTLAEAQAYQSELQASPVKPCSPIVEAAKASPIRGYPKSPQHPGWDEAVRQVKKIVEKREKREAEEARKQRKEIIADGSKLRKLQAGKDVVLRGSQLELTPKKPLLDMEEDEFENVGAFTLASEKATILMKKSRILNSFLTKIRGSNEEKDERAEQITAQLSKHRSLGALQSIDTETLDEQSTKDREKFESALQLLKESTHPMPSPNFTQSPDSSGSLHADSTCYFGTEALQSTVGGSGGPADPIGLGIVSQREAPDPNLDGDSNKARYSGPTLSNIAEEDVPIRDVWEDEDEDGSSWNTESLHTVDDVDEIKTPDEEEDDAISTYSTEFDAKAMPAPLNIRVLKVKRSSLQARPSSPNSFAPDRKASFHARLHQVSLLQESRIGSLSHPALRGAAETIESKTIAVQGSQNTMNDEGYATGRITQEEFYPEVSHLQTASTEAAEESAKQDWAGGSTASERGDVAENIDLGTLRATLGLEPLRLAPSNSPSKHPNHPFVWNHKKAMCREIHNSMEVLQRMPSQQPGVPTSLASSDSAYFNSPYSDIAEGLKACEACGSRCYRFADLLVASSIDGGGDVMKEKDRIEAQKHVNMLRFQHAGGIEDYETFFDCPNCGHHVCPKCAKKCNELLCQSVVCSNCCKRVERCPEHNYF